MTNVISSPFYIANRLSSNNTRKVSEWAKLLTDFKTTGVKNDKHV